MNRTGSFLAILIIATVPALAQWLNVPTKGIPRTEDGKPDLSAPAPRLSDGRPDLAGIWEPREGGKYAKDIVADLKPEGVPYQPWAKALFDSRVDGTHGREDPTASCLPEGVPKVNASPYPWKIVQTPGFLVIV